MRLIVIVTHVGSRCEDDAEYARRNGAPSPSGTSSVKNWPGTNAIARPAGSRSVSDTASAVSRVTPTTSSVRARAAESLAPVTGYTGDGGREMSGEGRGPNIERRSR